VETGDQRRHAHEGVILAFCEKMLRELPEPLGRQYVARTADMIKREYPGSTQTMVPKLREIYRSGRRSGQ
jgi:hypothetical protein